MLAWLVLLVAAPPPPQIGPADARALGELVTVSVARHRAFDVLSSSDLRRVVELEAEKATVGCSEETSCLAEVAGAMGARYVVFGQVAVLGSQIVLTLNLFDSSKGSSSGRVVVVGAGIDEIMPRIDGGVDELVKEEAAAAAAAKMRVLVLDLEAPRPGEQPPPAPVVVEERPAGLGFWLLLGGGAAATLGASAAAVGGFFAYTAGQAHQEATKAEFQDDAVRALTRRDDSVLAANVLYGVGAGALLAGAGAAVSSLFVGGEQ